MQIKKFFFTFFSQMDFHQNYQKFGVRTKWAKKKAEQKAQRKNKISF